MNTKKITGIILIVVSLALGYYGFSKIEGSDASVKVLGLEIDASNQSAKEQGYLVIGLAVVVFAGGLYTVGKKS